MAKKTAKQIVEEEMPEMEIVEAPATGVPDSVKRDINPGPSMADLRKKYLGAAAAEEEEEVDGAARSTAASEERDIEVKLVRPKTVPADPADDPGPRAVIISKKRGMLGSQG